jgi:copper/silver efflux system protein
MQESNDTSTSGVSGETRDELAPESGWARFVGFFLDNKIVVTTALALLVLAGLAHAPFRWDLGDLPRDPVPVDALPDVSENQQIVFTEWPGRSPRDVEDQVTYPLSTALLGLPGVRAIRSTSMFGFSSIFVIFDDGTDFYWSRSRVLEKLASLPAGTVPDDAAPMLGPDATALGQVFWYTLQPLDEHGEVVPGAFDLDELRSIQDWTVRYALQGVAGVSEVASVGGYVREYQVDVDPRAMLAHGVTIGEVAAAVRGANLDTGARTIEINRAEYIVRGLGFIREPSDLEEVVVATRDHTPIRVRDVGKVGFGPALRRGVLDVGGAEAVGGVVTVRFGDNPMAVIDRIRDRIDEISPGLPSRTMPDGTMAQVRIVPFYDRTQLIDETLDTLSRALIQQILVTVLVVLLIMRHVRSSVLVAVLLPFGVLSTFVLMRYTGVDANVMSLAGIAISIGIMVDMGIVFVENMVRHLDEAPPNQPTTVTIRRAVGEVAPAVFTTVLTTILGFIPVFGLTEAEGKLFTPLAFTKTYALTASFVLALVMLPVLGHLYLRSRSAGARESLLRRCLGRHALFDWAFVTIGIALLSSGWGVVGLVAMAVGGLHLVVPAVSERWRWIPSSLAIALTVVAVTIGLTQYWIPLGPGRGMFANTAFVVVMVAGLMGGFWMFTLVYRPLLHWCLRHKIVFLLGNVAFVLFGLSAWLGLPRTTGWLPEPVRETRAYAALSDALPGLKTDFLPPFDEGSYLYMPTTTPHASIGQASEMLAHLDAAIAEIPEVTQVVGKLGRAESPLDPAPISMFETVINYEPEFKLDARGRIGRYRWDDASETFVRDEQGELVEDPAGRPFRQWRDHIRSPDDIWKEIDKAAELPGVTGAPKLMPIITRIVMLQTGMRSPVGIKVEGPDLETIETFGLALEAILKDLPETISPGSVFADRIVGKPYLEIDIDREAIGRHGLTIADVQDVIQVAIGGRVLTRTVEGRERYPVRVRYMREERDHVEALRDVLVPGRAGEHIPLQLLADIRYVRGPQMIRAENTFLNGYVTFDPASGVGEVESVEVARARIEEKIAAGELEVPAGVSYRFVGTYESQVRSEQRLKVLVPVALAVIFMVLVLELRRTALALMVFTGIALAGAGGFIFIWLYAQPWFLDAEPFGVDLQSLFQVGEVRVTVAVWVGFLALFAEATDNGVILATYLRHKFRGPAPESIQAVRARVVEAGERRVRPCVMITATTMLALLPVVTAPGKGADLMVPMALPTIGGIGLSLTTLLTVPVLFSAVEEWRLWRSSRRRRAKDRQTDGGPMPG